MTRFKKIVAVDETLLNEEALQQLQKLGEEVVVYHDFPQDEHIVTERRHPGGQLYRLQNP